ncbi:MAG: 2-amino-4-hydroxy-6-hydroxymethyldihydropteridine diphosphokinase [Nitrospinae bacterium]|nr:2-amino-4-hydroxy-6-hydroxymethyldihydropteridine diphosphokinase [Nitrospinota bacterium]
MALVYLSLGSNAEDAIGKILDAIERIMALGGVAPAGLGSFYETEPQGVKDQPWFVNTAMAARLSLAPEKLLERLKEIEHDMGREPGERWGPRVIDIDIVFYDDVVMDTPPLTIPHPRAAERRFVLQPIADINPRLRHPVSGKTVSELLTALPESGQALRRLDP